MDVRLHDLAVSGLQPRSETDGNEQGGTHESKSLFDGSGCDMEGVEVNINPQGKADFDVDAEINRLFFDSGVFDTGLDKQTSLDVSGSGNASGTASDADMDSLFGGLDDEPPLQEEQHQPAASPFAFPLTLPVSELVLPPTGRIEQICDVSTLHQHIHQQQEQEQEKEQGQDIQGQNGQNGESGLLSLGSGLDFSLDFDMPLDIDLDGVFDIGQAVETWMAQQEKENEKVAVEKEAETLEALVLSRLVPVTNTKPNTNTVLPASDAADIRGQTSQHARPGIDTSSHATGLGTRDDQEGRGSAPIVVDENDDVVILSARQVQGFVSPSPSVPPPPTLVPPRPTSIPHYLELRPRCPQGPPPQRIDLGHFNVEELLPHVQLHSKLSLRGIQELLGLDIDAGRYIVDNCNRHLANPAHAVHLSGSSDPMALRGLKLNLILSSLALLKDGDDGRPGVGRRWFGRDTALEPKSMHVWPDDSTTLCLLFIQLLYKLLRNKSTRNRYNKKLNSGSPSPGSTTGYSPSAHSPQSANAPKSPEPLSPAESELKTPEPLREKENQVHSEEPKESSETEKPKEPKKAAPRKRKRNPPKPRPPKPDVAIAPVPPPPRPPINFAYSSPRVLRDALLSANEKSQTASPPPISVPSPTHTPTPPPVSTNDLGPTKRPPPNAIIQYHINIIDSRTKQRLVPQISLPHEGFIARAGYSCVMESCARQDRARNIDNVSIMTTHGLERVYSDVGWDRAVGRVSNDVLLDGEVRVLVSVK